MKKIYLLLQSITLLLLVGGAKAQLKIGDQPTSIHKSVILDLQGTNGRQGIWLPRVTDTSDVTGIDALNPPNGVMIFLQTTQEIYIRRNGYWRQTLPTTGIYSINHTSGTVTGVDVNFATGTVAGTTKDFHLSVSGATQTVTFNLPDAASDTRGVITTGVQTLSGPKTFTDTLTARLTPPAGTATAKTAPLKFKAGTNLTTPENGAVEYDGSNYYVTSDGTRYTLAKTLTTTATLNFGQIGSNSSASLTVTLAGAAAGDVVLLGLPTAGVTTNITYTAYVTAPNTVTVMCVNAGTGQATTGSGTFRVTILKY
jgi:hypothetical protein